MSGNALQLLINGTDRTSNLKVGGGLCQLHQTFGRKGSTFDFVIEDNKPSTTTFNWVPSYLQTVTLKDTTLGVTLFGGLITNITWADVEPASVRWQITAKDYSIILDKTVVKGDYASGSWTADGIIKDLLTQVPGAAISSSGVQAGPQVGRMIINYTSLTDAINRVTKIASVGEIYGWYVDNARNLQWYNQTQASLVTPYFTDDETDNGGNAYRYNTDFTYEINATDVRNRITVRGGNTNNNTQTDTWVQQAGQVAWPLTYAVYTSTPNFTLTVGGVSKTVAVDSGSSSPTTQYVVTKTVPGLVPVRGQWYLRPGTDSAPSSGTALVLAYRYVAPVITQVDDTTSQGNLSSLPNNGIFWTSRNDQSVADIITAKQLAQRDLAIYSLAEENVNFTTVETTFNQHVKAGDIINWRSKQIGDPQNSNASPVNANYIILEESIDIDYGNYRAYKIKGLRV